MVERVGRTAKTITGQLRQMAEQLADMEEDAARCDNGNKAAGTRIRTGLMEIRKKCDSVRKDVLAKRNS